MTKGNTSGVIRRRENRSLGLFIDGVALDRATRRLQRKVEMSKLIRGVSSGLTPNVARYYTLIPHEDDSRQRAFLDALIKAGLQVVVKRLPPKGIDRQVSIASEMAADIVAFAMGYENFSGLSLYKPEESLSTQEKVNESSGEAKRIVTVVCPSRDVGYAISLAKEMHVDTISADFGQFNNADVLKSAAKWIDLSDSETIWRE